jgi:hypothetical protein
MTTRVFDFHRQPTPVEELRRQASNFRSRRSAGVKGSALAAMVSVPVAGAAEPPAGWLAAALVAVLVVCVAAICGPRIKWGLLALVAGGVGMGMPRGQWGIVGPPLFVATVMCLVLWHVNRCDRRADAGRRVAGPSVQAAQVMAGLSGERQVASVLASELPQDYALVNGLKLARGSGDIDHLVIGPSGVFLLETKTMAGRVECAPDGTWRRTRSGRGGAPYAAYIGDPATQVQRNIFAVRRALSRQLPELVRHTPLWIEGLIVFAHPKTELEAGRSRVPAVTLSDAAARIRAHAPRRRLQPKEVDAILAALLLDAHRPRVPRSGVAAQALVELAVLLPVVLVLAFGALGVSRYVQTQVAVVAVAHEAARAGALASSPADAIDRMQQRATQVAPGLGLDTRSLALAWDLTRFGNTPGQVQVAVTYMVGFGDLPMVGGLLPIMVHAAHTEWVDPFRSGMSLASGGGP